MIINGKEHLPPTIKIKDTDEEEIKEFVRDLVLSDHDPDSEDVHSEDTLRFDFIRKEKCDIAYADRVIEKMKQDGLALCKQSTVGSSNFLYDRVQDYSTTYNLAKFANLRGYMTIHEFATIMKKRIEIRREIEKEEEREKRFVQKYGPIAEWSTEVQEMYDDSEYDDTSLT